MHLLLASFSHETNTFSSDKTRLPEFFGFRDVPVTGEEAVRSRRGTGSSIGGHIDYLESENISFDLAVAANAWPSGVVAKEAYEQIVGLITDALAARHYDGVLLELHGAMVAEEFEDGEGELLRRLREINSTIPIGVTLDMHANNYAALVDKVTVLTGYHTYPHVDMNEAGQRCAGLLIRTLRGEIKPTIAFGTRPMLPHIMRQGTHENPNRSLQAACIDLEKEQCLAASLFTGFPHADIEYAGLSVVVVTDGDQGLADSICDRLLTQAWEERAGFNYQPSPLESSITKAKQSTDFPVAILDHCDNVGSGGPMDTTVVLAEMIRQGLTDAVFFAIRDPQAVEAAAKAGVGATVTLTIGGHAQFVATGEDNPPLTISGRVRTLHDGQIKLHGPMKTGMIIPIGKTAVIDVAGILVVLISERTEPADISYFSSLGIDVRSKKYIAIKSRVHWRAGLGDIVAKAIESDGIGITTSDYSKLKFKKVRRPIYPLDAIDN
ncbi:M81 family metallopeptidase [Alcaligenaceae bacterium]|nr:M81 family metallopeptidase [Alcaligenaceae bacterium]